MVSPSHKICMPKLVGTFFSLYHTIVIFISFISCISPFSLHSCVLSCQFISCVAVIKKGKIMNADNEVLKGTFNLNN